MNRQQLIEDNMNLVYFVLHKYYPTFVGDEDIVQTGMVALCKAANTWDEEKGAFSTYAVLCIQNGIRHYFRDNKKHKNILSLDYEVRGKDGEPKEFGDLLVGEEDVDYVNVEDVYNNLSSKDKEIFNLRCAGMNNTDIGKYLGCSHQAIQQRVRKIRKIWRKVNGDSN